MEILEYGNTYIMLTTKIHLSIKDIEYFFDLYILCCPIKAGSLPGCSSISIASSSRDLSVVYMYVDVLHLLENYWFKKRYHVPIQGP